MTDRLKCPQCGNDTFEQERTMLYEEFCELEFGLNGEIEEECCGEESSEACRCTECGWELVDDDGEPITSAEEIVEKFRQSTNTKHSPTHIREAFQEFLESDDDTVEVDGTQVGLNWFMEMLADCTDILPAGYCSDLDLPQGSTYGDAVAHLSRRDGQ